LVKELAAELKRMKLTALTVDERASSNGRFREGEEAMYETLLDVVDEHPHVFSSLSDRDGGRDDQTVETAPTRALLARRRMLAPLAEALTELSQLVADDVLVTGEEIRAFTSPAYGLGKANSTFDASLKSDLAPVMNFYSSLRTRRAAPRA
jgi:hypothetical protein